MPPSSRTPMWLQLLFIMLQLLPTHRSSPMLPSTPHITLCRPIMRIIISSKKKKIKNKKIFQHLHQRILLRKSDSQTCLMQLHGNLWKKNNKGHQNNSTENLFDKAFNIRFVSFHLKWTNFDGNNKKRSWKIVSFLISWFSFWFEVKASDYQGQGLWEIWGRGIRKNRGWI